MQMNLKTYGKNNNLKNNNLKNNNLKNNNLKNNNLKNNNLKNNNFILVYISKNFILRLFYNKHLIKKFNSLNDGG